MPDAKILPLFRREAIEAQVAHEYGARISLLPGSWRVLTAFFLLVLVAAVTFLSTHNFARRETAAGVIANSGGEIRVIPPKGGTITDIFVHEGQDVVAGAELVRVTTAQDMGTDVPVDAQLLQVIEQEKAALQRRLEAMDAAAPLELQSLRDRIGAEKVQLSQMHESLAHREEELDTARATYEAGTKYRDRGLISADYERQRLYEYLARARGMNEFKVQLAGLEGAIAQDEAALDKLPHEQAERRTALVYEITALEEKRIAASGQASYVITARVSGRVTALQAKVGQTIAGPRPLMMLISRESNLQAELFVPSRAIGFVKEGQRVRLLYEAFPHQQFGPGLGTVREISATVLKPEEVGAAIRLQEPTYRVIVAPASTTVSAYGVQMPLRAGMAVNADLILEQRSFMSLLLDPLLSAGSRVLGERDNAS